MNPSLALCREICYRLPLLFATMYLVRPFPTVLATPSLIYMRECHLAISPSLCLQLAKQQLVT